MKSKTSSKWHLNRAGLVALALLMGCAGGLWAQSSTASLRGVVSDPSGAVVPGAALRIENLATGATRETESGPNGSYDFQRLSPGSYSLDVAAPGFSASRFAEVDLRVNVSSNLDVVLSLEAVGDVVNVSAAGPVINTTDASVGNAIGEKQILQLPLEARNVAGLLSLQTGVTFLGHNFQDARNGAVNGGRSDQANVTLDGVDVNDQRGRQAFTSVLRSTLDSVQEFRVTTIGANADQGRSSGAQIALVTKSGSNELHGSAYYFHRNTVTTANSYFNNSSGVDRAKLLRNIFGASVGGPIKRNRLFFFGNFEGRRDASESNVAREVPGLSLRQGTVRYLNTDGGVSELDSERLRQYDPLGIGVNNAALQYLSAFPKPNDTSLGDGVNTLGYRFVARTPLNWKTYITRWDWMVDEAGSHSLFFRGNLQNDSSEGVPQFPGQVANSAFISNAKGVAIGYNHILSPTVVGSARYGFTRTANEMTGIQNSPYASPYNLNVSTLIGRTLGQVAITPVHTISEDVSWTENRHMFQFGGVARVIRRQSINAQPYAESTGAAYQLDGEAFELIDPLSDFDDRFTADFTNAAMGVLGVLSAGNATYNYNVDGSELALGEPVRRNFGNEEFELYAQDTWRIKSNLTMIGGLRWSLMPPPRELNGQQTSMLPSYGQLVENRLADAAAGRSGAHNRVTFVGRDTPEGQPLYPTHKKNFAPRLSLAYSPGASDGWLSKVTGGPGKTTIRAGAGMFYDLFGSGLINSLDEDSFGLRTNLVTPIGRYSLATAPRFVSMTTVPDALIPGAPAGGPGTPPDGLVQGVDLVDQSLKPPYVINLNFGISRQITENLGIEVTYVGRLTRRQLVKDQGGSQPLNFVDPESGMTLYEAMDVMDRHARNNTPGAEVSPVPFWENLYSQAATADQTATQVVYSRMGRYPTDPVTGLVGLDSSCRPACSDLGPYTFMQPQFWGLFALQSYGTASYHGLQTTLRKRFSQGVQFDLNYTLSKSLDLYSQNETRVGYRATRAVLNVYDREAQRAVSDYDMTHQMNANWVVELPFGRGRSFLDQGGVADVLFGGWQVSGLMRLTSGLPYAVMNGYHYPLTWSGEVFATPIAETPEQGAFKNSATGGPNIFQDPLAAARTFDFTPTGQIGQRNSIRGDGLFSVDLGIGKRFQLPIEGHSVQFRAEAFNLTNTPTFTFGAGGNELFIDSARFGGYTQELSTPRVIQFGLRYEF